MRQLLGAANIDGSPLFHVASGNLGYQVEHHLYPDMPSTRYAEIAPRVQGDLRALRAALQHGAVPQAARRRAADDPAPRLPGRHAAPEAGPVPGGDSEAAPATRANGGPAAAAGNGGQARPDRDDGEPAAAENVPAEKPTDD